MSQSLSSVLLHLVFSTKHRNPLITPGIEPELYAYLATVFRACGSPVLKIGGDKDHIHALFSLSRTKTIAEVVEEIKKRSSKWIKTKGDEFKNFGWQGGYGIFSVSESNAEAVKQYIASQKEHHARIDFQTEYRELLRKYKVEYDERYVWD
ncbi:MAG TPA: IS200/IS605 family transposase [Pyrinomonadaceae bacterium]|jgi:REP element-mobilizing transposase RayT|nr:IS200/IS605 family transposase [Pyrinomonadaceae bacterium]